MQDKEHSQPLWAAFIGWVTGVALFLAFVVQPAVALFCSVLYPLVKVPEVSLANMWPPVLAILGVTGMGLGQRFINLRETRKNRELDVARCSNCPGANCAVCPVKLDKEKPPTEVGGSKIVGSEGA